VELHAVPLAVEDQFGEFTLQVGLYLQEFQPHLLRGDCDQLVISPAGDRQERSTAAPATDGQRPLGADTARPWRRWLPIVILSAILDRATAETACASSTCRGSNAHMSHDPIVDAHGDEEVAPSLFAHRTLRPRAGIQ
jgi:hypothetical protein